MFSRYLLPDKKTEKVATHQRLDKIARKLVVGHLPKKIHFPTAKEIIHFEGMNGPDGLASKKADTADEPWQFILPDFSDTRLLNHVADHIYNLNEASKKQDKVRMSFELAWMAHMIVDGLSPSHHYPLRSQLQELDSRDINDLRSRMSRIVAPGDNIKEFLQFNWRRSGPKGVMTNHVLFEMGVELIMTTYQSRKPMFKLDKNDIKRAKSGEYIELLKASITYIDSYKMFERYEKKGWTERLARDVRKVMIPEMAKMIALGWIAGIYYK